MAQQAVDTKSIAHHRVFFCDILVARTIAAFVRLDTKADLDWYLHSLVVASRNFAATKYHRLQLAATALVKGIEAEEAANKSSLFRRFGSHPCRHPLLSGAQLGIPEARENTSRLRMDHMLELVCKAFYELSELKELQRSRGHEEQARDAAALCWLKGEARKPLGSSGLCSVEGCCCPEATVALRLILVLQEWEPAVIFDPFNLSDSDAASAAGVDDTNSARERLSRDGSCAGLPPPTAVNAAPPVPPPGAAFSSFSSGLNSSSHSSWVVLRRARRAALGKQREAALKAARDRKKENFAAAREAGELAELGSQVDDHSVCVGKAGEECFQCSRFEEGGGRSTPASLRVAVSLKGLVRGQPRITLRDAPSCLSRSCVAKIEARLKESLFQQRCPFSTASPDTIQGFHVSVSALPSALDHVNEAYALLDEATFSARKEKDHLGLEGGSETGSGGGAEAVVGTLHAEAFALASALRSVRAVLPKGFDPSNQGADVKKGSFLLNLQAHIEQEDPQHRRK